jgi:predicted Zn-dependent peptidase
VPTTQTTRLPNKVTLAATPMPHMHSVAIGLWTGLGSRHENAQTSGAAHFIEHLLFKGTPSRDSATIAREIERIGGSVNAFTSEDHTCYYVSGPADRCEQLSDVLCDMYNRPLMQSADVDLERDVIKEEIAMVRDQPAQWLEDLLSEAAWGNDHPLGRTITGTSATLDAMDRDHLLGIHAAGYVGAQTVATIAGCIEANDALQILSDRLSDLPVGAPTLMTPAPAPGRPSRIEIDDIEQAHLAIGFHTTGRHDESRYALKLLNVILGENMSSMLFQKLREQEAVCYSVQSDVMTFDDTGLLHIYAAVDPKNLDRTLTVTTETLAELMQSDIDDRTVEDAKAYVIGQSRIALENTSSQMMWSGESLLSYDQVRDPEISHDRIAAVTAEEMRSIATAIFTPENLVLAAVTPKQCTTKLEGWSEKFSAVLPKS